MIRGVIMLSGVLFFLFYTRMGIFNRMLFGLVVCNSLIFFNKTIFYQRVIEEVAHEMTLTGQEARILVRYYFPDHPQKPLLEDLCKQYKELSEKQLEEQEEREHRQMEKQFIERSKDAEFERRLKSIDLEE